MVLFRYLAWWGEGILLLNDFGVEFSTEKCGEIEGLSNPSPIVGK